MKNYTITVNGTTYDVTVEEGNGVTQPEKAPVQKVVKQTSAPAKVAPTGAKGSIKINSPMPGKILAVKAEVGQAVKRGQPIVVLEAMKMENEIVAPSDGTVASVDVTVGSSVEAGAILATLK